jgi:hypothetical protein
MTDQSTDDQMWAEVIRRSSTADGVKSVVSSINLTTHARTANQADVIVACAMILGQSIDGPDIAAEMRRGIMAMIDGFAMEFAIARS